MKPAEVAHRPSGRVLVLYNEPLLPADHPDARAEHDILSTVDVVRRTLASAGYEVSDLCVSRDPAVLIAGLRERRPDVVFNLFEGTAEQADSETYVAGVLQWLGVPFTGSPAEALTLARNKPLAKTLLRGAGLPTADYLVVERLPVPPCALAWPVIVKPGAQDASLGLDHGSIISDPGRLELRVASLLERYGPPVLIEEYLDGRELIVGLIETPELEALPVGEILFLDRSPGRWPIVTYEAKWSPGSHEDTAAPSRYPADIPAVLAERLRELAMRAFRQLGCRDYARVDFRLSRAGEPHILEVNPNPDFSPDAGLAAALKAQGSRTHAQLAVQLVENARQRGVRNTRCAL
jgi:D-alanine-D-alanine ligase